MKITTGRACSSSFHPCFTAIIDEPTERKKRVEARVNVGSEDAKGWNFPDRLVRRPDNFLLVAVVLGENQTKKCSEKVATTDA